MQSLTASNSSLFEFSVPGCETGFRVTGFEGEECISKLFQYTLQLANENPGLDLAALIGLPAMLFYRDSQGHVFRTVHGIIGTVEQGDTGRRFTHYSLQLVSWLNLLTLRRDCRMFQNMDVQEVVTAVFQSAAIARDHFQFHLRNSYGKRLTCVQYRESDYDFVARLLEQEGIFYYFEHSINGHVLILADDAAVHQAMPDTPTLYYRPGPAAGAADSVFPFASGHRLRSGAVVLRDYNYLKPRLNQEVRESGDTQRDSGLEVYEYPGAYAVPEEGKHYARLREQALHLESRVIRGASKSRNMITGCRFKLERHPRADLNADYVIRSSRCSASQPQALDADAPVAPAQYQCEFTCVPAQLSCIPSLHTPKPRIDGIQTAIVTGPAGEEIYTDEYGRVKVQFHWDRLGGFDEHSSAWVRVAQSSAGTRWGTLFLPRVDQEVVVEFEEGDPDRPVVIGALYHSVHRPPYNLPEHKARTTLRSRSTPGGDTGNELCFDDNKDEEHLLLHASRDFSLRASHDSREFAGNDRHLIVGRDQLESVDGDKHQQVSGEQVLQIEGMLSISTGGDLQIDAAQDIAVSSSGDLHIAAGGHCVLEAPAGLTIKAGGNFIKIDAGGITMVGKLVRINSGGTAGAGKGVSTEVARAPEEALAGTHNSSKRVKPERPKTAAAAQQPATTVSPQARVLQQAARDGTPLVNKCKPSS